MSSLIELTQLAKAYLANGEIIYALKSVDFSVSRGEMIAILGKSGSGKSTLMNIIGFLDRRSSGTYLFNGRDVSHLENAQLAKLRNKAIGFVFQSSHFLPRFDVLSNVMLPLFYRNESKEISKQKALHILDKVGMKSFKSHKPYQLSGGQQQRVAIARALVGDPEIILADEPTGALDSKTGKQIMDLLLDLNQAEGRTIIMVTHDLSISQLCKRTVTIKDGTLIE